VHTIMLLFLCFVKQIKKDLRLKRIEEIVSRENAEWKICIKNRIPKKNTKFIERAFVKKKGLKRKSYIIERQDNLNNIFGRGDKNKFNSLTLIIYNHNVCTVCSTYFTPRIRIN
jgi:hypothetical protein